MFWWRKELAETHIAVYLRSSSADTGSSSIFRWHNHSDRFRCTAASSVGLNRKHVYITITCYQTCLWAQPPNRPKTVNNRSSPIQLNVSSCQRVTTSSVFPVFRTFSSVDSIQLRRRPDCAQRCNRKRVRNFFTLIDHPFLIAIIINNNNC